MHKHTKRENFEVTSEQQSEIEALQAITAAPTKKDALLMAVHVTLHLATELKKGNQLFIGQPGQQDLKRLVMLGIEKPEAQRWIYLVEQAHPWKRQLFVKGRKLSAASVWTALRANKLSPQEAAENWDLPVDAILEIVDYCETNKALLEMEAAEELRRLEEKGVNVVSQVARR